LKRRKSVPLQGRTPINLSEAMQQRLQSYALAAGAAGVAAMACSLPAEAAPVCKDLALRLFYADTYAFNPAAQRIAPFNIAQTTFNYSSSTSARFYSWNRAFFTPNSAGAKVLRTVNNYPANIASGASIGPGGQFGKGESYGMLFTYGIGLRFGPRGHGTLLKHRGNFNLQQINYVGFQFSNSGKVHYGWARLRVTFEKNQGKHTILHVLGYGYETNPDTAITAGSCSAHATTNGGSDPSDRTEVGQSPAAADLHGSLGVLALGSQSHPSAVK
jgi:hypothetical protein